MAIKSEQYDPLKIQKLKHHLQMQAEAGQPRHYEIFVDILRVVPKTDKIELFDQYEDFLTEDTEKIRILLFSHANNNQNDQYVYYVRQQNEQTLRGTSSKEAPLKYERQLMKYENMLERSQNKNEDLERELSKEKEKLKELEEYTGKLEDQVFEYKNKKLHLGNVNLGELASQVVEGFVRRNPQMLAKLPGGEALAGIIVEDNNQRSNTPPAANSEVTFQPQAAGKNISEEEQGYIDFMSSLAEHFSEEEIGTLTSIIQKLQDDPSKLSTVADLLEVTGQI